MRQWPVICRVVLIAVGVQCVGSPYLVQFHSGVFTIVTELDCTFHIGQWDVLMLFTVLAVLDVDSTWVLIFWEFVSHGFLTMTVVDLEFG